MVLSTLPLGTVLGAKKQLYNKDSLQTGELAIRKLKKNTFDQQMQHQFLGCPPHVENLPPPNHPEFSIQTPRTPFLSEAPLQAAWGWAEIFHGDLPPQSYKLPKK